MTYLYEYLLFLAQAATVTVVLLVVLSALASLGARRSQSNSGHLTVSKLNEQLDEFRDNLRSVVLDADVYKHLTKQEAKATKAEVKAERKKAKAHVPAETSDPSVEAAPGIGPAAVDALPVAAALPGRPRLYVIDFEGDVQASKVDHLRQEVTAVLTVAAQEDEILIRIESPGGLVHAYGLAASQLARIRSRGIPLTVAVDKVAASGGYMMAAVANRILAAPFAVLGSIGVVAQVPNVHRLLKKNDVDVEILTAGKYKRTLTVIGENTEAGREKFIEELEVTHQLFQDHVVQYRPELDIEAVATGEAWYGQRAIEMKLVDQIITSDDYMILACQVRDVYQLAWKEDKKPLDRIFERIQSAFGRIAMRLLGRSRTQPGIRASSEFSTMLGRIGSTRWQSKLDLKDE